MIVRLLRWIDVHVYGADRCVDCGCTDRFGCPEGCSWAVGRGNHRVCTSCWNL